MDWRVGHRAFYYVSKRALGRKKTTTISWSGPFDVVVVRTNTLVLLRNGKKVTVNQTQCVALEELSIPERDMRGKALDKEASDRKEQDRITKEKLQKLAQRLNARRRGGSVSDSEEDSEDDVFNDESPEEHKLKQLAKKRPDRKFAYGLADLRDGCVMAVSAFDAMRLGQYLFHRFVPTGRDP